MLVLCRKTGQALVMHEGEREVRVSILSVHEGQVRIGIEAADEVSIRRAELPPRAMRRTAPAPESSAPAPG